MKKEILTVSIIIVIISLCSTCLPLNLVPHLPVQISIHNKSSETISFHTQRLEGQIINEDGKFIEKVPAEDEYKDHGPIDPGSIGIFSLSGGFSYNMLCKGSPSQWGPQEVYIEYNTDFEWTILDKEPEQTGDIVVNNNTFHDIRILISNTPHEFVDLRSSKTFTTETGTHQLEAFTIDGSNFNWFTEIELTDSGYVWTLKAEEYPTEDCYVWNFEKNIEDQYGINDWDEYEYISYNNTEKKFGDYSLMRPPNFPTYLIMNNLITIGASHSIGIWFYPKIPLYFAPFFVNAWGSENEVLFYEDHQLLVGITKNDESEIKIYSLFGNIVNDKWHFISFGYDSLSDIYYITIDAEIYSTEKLGGTWGESQTSNKIFSRIVIDPFEYRHDYYLDELFISPNEFIDPQVFVDHYNHNAPWGEGYTE